MSYVDSEVVFRARCDEIKLTEDTFLALRAKGWATFGSYAFSVSTNPGQISDEDFDSKVAIPVLGSSAHAEAALLRRLLFESYTLTATELRRKTDSSESDGPKKLPVQEIASRFEALQVKSGPHQSGERIGAESCSDKRSGPVRRGWTASLHRVGEVYKQIP